MTNQWFQANNWVFYFFFRKPQARESFLTLHIDQRFWQGWPACKDWPTCLGHDCLGDKSTLSKCSFWEYYQSLYIKYAAWLMVQPHDPVGLPFIKWGIDYEEDFKETPEGYCNKIRRMYPERRRAVCFEEHRWFYCKKVVGNPPSLDVFILIFLFFSFNLRFHTMKVHHSFK